MELLQTILWVGLIAGIVWRFHQPIDGILHALHHRIESGSGVRAGPFELTQQLRPLPPEQQAARLEAEVSQLQQADVVQGDAATQDAPPTESTRQLRDRYQQAEDLALREIQSEYGAPINRQVTLGKDQGFDGFFVQDGSAHIVEVKLVRKRVGDAVLRQSAARLVSSVDWYGWRNVEIILSFVIADASIDADTEQRRVSRLAAEFDNRIVVKCYSLETLARRYGTDSV